MEDLPAFRTAVMEAKKAVTTGAVLTTSAGATAGAGKDLGVSGADSQAIVQVLERIERAIQEGVTSFRTSSR